MIVFEKIPFWLGSQLAHDSYEIIPFLPDNCKFEVFTARIHQPERRQTDLNIFSAIKT